MSNRSKDLLIKNLRSGKQSPLSGIPEEYKNDRDVFLARCLKRGDVLRELPEGHPFRDDKEIILAAVQDRWDGGYNLQYASQRLQSDKEVVMAAVVNGGIAYEFASHDLAMDKEIQQAAVRGAKNNTIGTVLEEIGKKAGSLSKEMLVTAYRKNKDLFTYPQGILKEIPKHEIEEIKKEAAKEEHNQEEISSEDISNYKDRTTNKIQNFINNLKDRNNKEKSLSIDE